MTGDAGASGSTADLASVHYSLRLYVTGSTARSARAVENLHRICEAHLPGRYDLQVIDIYQHPEAARDFQVIAVPTLVRLRPEPVRRIIGDLSDQAKVLQGLDLLPASSAVTPEM